jgi:hypothetical protein
MRRSVAGAATILSLAALVLLPAGVAAHGGGLPWIYIEAERVLPGQPFHVLVIDVTPFTNVQLEAERGALRVSLGAVAAGPRGHGEVDVALPADFPLGYAALNGLAEDGSRLTASLLVGDVPASGGPLGPPGPSGPAAPGAPDAGWLGDPSVWTLGALLAGAAGLVGYMLVRRMSGRQPPRPAAVTNAARRAPRKRRRR